MKINNLTIEQEAINLIKDKRLFNDNYKIKCLKWHQRIRIFFNSWFAALQVFPMIFQYLKKEQKNGIFVRNK